MGTFLNFIVTECNRFLESVDIKDVNEVFTFSPFRAMLPVMKTERKTEAINVRLAPELKARLASAARRLDLSENDIARHAIRAALHAIEANRFELKLPLRMKVSVKSAPAIEKRRSRAE